MKQLADWGIVISFLVVWCSLELPAQDLIFHYNEPAQKWTEALPLGNGRLGAMVYGGVNDEIIQFNEETLWTGGPNDYSHKGAHEYLEAIRALLWAGNQHEAEALAAEHFMSEPLRLKAYQPFGDLLLHFDHTGTPQHYTRKLDLENAITEVSYRVDGTNYKREVLASFPDQLIAVHLTADRAAGLNFSFGLDSKHPLKSVETNFDRQVLAVNVLNGEMEGKAMLMVKTDGQISPGYDDIAVKNASYATLYLTAYTNFVNYRDLSRPSSRYIDHSFRNFEALSFDEIRQKHLEDYHKLFDRFSIRFDQTGNSSLPTDERIFAFWKAADDPQLLALYIQYGRYLTIASSRPGTQPANLQGIWNDRLEPSWDSKWTTNINCEMNYWPVELTNLPECHEPLFRLIEECAETGAEVAREHYDADGWVLHHNTDIWRATAPVNASNHGIWVSGGAWLCHHLWEHFLFTQDTAFLREKYPLIKGAALFFKDFLVEDPKSGYLVSTPSNSPEIGGLVAGPTMDHQIVRSLFNITAQAAGILQVDQKLAKQLTEMRAKILPNQIGQYGQLQEWMQDIDDPGVKHRHVSHLWGLFPGKEISPQQTPELARAAEQSLVFRGDEGTGWSLAWKINFWARLLQGDHAFELIHMLLSPAETKGRDTRGGSYPNLFDAHPPFQIDGNFGGTAGIIELLVQSQNGYIDVLPALPDQLAAGSIDGVCTRGAFELSFSWREGQLEQLRVLSKAGKKCSVKYAGRQIEFDTESGVNYVFDKELKRVE
ncbi:MAG: glycoside hydrolase family 95 protein [Saprospiraceae bacterium]|nr:glycoside hydrolase family 95 protein [Lewinella sp.]